MSLGGCSVSLEVGMPTSSDRARPRTVGVAARRLLPVEEPRATTLLTRIHRDAVSDNLPVTSRVCHGDGIALPKVTRALSATAGADARVGVDDERPLLVLLVWSFLPVSRPTTTRALSVVSLTVPVTVRVPTGDRSVSPEVFRAGSPSRL